jgi:hypothetical protein
MDSPLEGDGFELFVPRHESREFRSIPGIAGSSRTGEGDAGGGLHRRYRGGPSHRGFVRSCMRSVIDTKRRLSRRPPQRCARRRPAPVPRTRCRRRAITRTLSDGPCRFRRAAAHRHLHAKPARNSPLIVLSLQSANRTLAIGDFRRDHGVPGFPRACLRNETGTIGAALLQHAAPDSLTTGIFGRRGKKRLDQSLRKADPHTLS